MHEHVNRRQLNRVRWAVRAVLVLGVAASVVANILHARPNPISQTIAAWPPSALLLTVELISRVPISRRLAAAARVANRRAAMSPQQKAAATRKARRELADPVAAVRALPADAPVSPGI